MSRNPFATDVRSGEVVDRRRVAKSAGRLRQDSCRSGASDDKTNCKGLTSENKRVRKSCNSCARDGHITEAKSALLHQVSAEGFFIWLWQPLPCDLCTTGAFLFPDTRGRPAMIVEFSIRPMRQPSREPAVPEVVETMVRARENGRPRSMTASIEGSWDEVMSVIRGCHQAHANSHPRVVTTIVVVDDSNNGHINGWPRVLHEILPVAQDQLGDGHQRVRRIPVKSRESVTR